MTLEEAMHHIASTRHTKLLSAPEPIHYSFHMLAVLFMMPELAITIFYVGSHSQSKSLITCFKYSMRHCEAKKDSILSKGGLWTWRETSLII